MDACLAASLLYFLVPNPVACPSDAAIAAQEDQDKAYKEWRDSLDFSFLEMPYAGCKLSKPVSPTLSVRERCYVSTLSARCSEADDCLVQCIARGNNGKVGGGCWHICFESKFDLSQWKENKAMAACSKLDDATPGVEPLTREKGIALAEKAARYDGYALEEFRLSTSNKELSKDGKEWRFLYECSPPADPSCHFSVVVDRNHGRTRVIPRTPTMSEKQVIALANAEAKKRNIDISQYTCLAAHYEFVRKNDTWSVFYSPKSPTSSASPFSVLIHDKTKVVKVQ